jgi:osmotically-inducible protein OsmY
MKNDLQLQKDIMDELQWEPSLDAARIGVSVRDGVVALTGQVMHYAEKMKAEQVAKRVYGVKAVANDITVDVPGSLQRTDADIAAAAVMALRWDVAVPDEHIKVTVRKGWVSLDGTVEWQYEKEAADRVVRNLTGIKGVTNLITVKPKVSASEVKHKIEAAFKRSAEVDARRVGVETHDGKVVLHGRVKSWMELDEALHAAWAAPGVTQVENHITVTP